MKKIESYLKNIKKIGITGHIRPDGDCVGSCLALYMYLVKNHKDIEVDVYLDAFPEKFNFLPGINDVNYERKDKHHDLFITLDVSDEARMGSAQKYFKVAGKTLCIDHHISNPGFANENVIIPTASSTGEVLFGLLEEDKIDRSIATCLFTGIVYDSGVFKYQNTSRHTMEVAGRLMEYDIPFSKIIDDSFYSKTYNQNLILGEALINSKLTLDGKVIYTLITRKQMDQYNLTSKDLDGIVDQLRVTIGIACALFINEIIPGEYKVSLRSNNGVDVNKVASVFGGGGHLKAAGCSVKGSYEKVVEALSQEIQKQL